MDYFAFILLLFLESALCPCRAVGRCVVLCRCHVWSDWCDMYLMIVAMNDVQRVGEHSLVKIWISILNVSFNLLYLAYMACAVTVSVENWSCMIFFGGSSKVLWIVRGFLNLFLKGNIVLKVYTEPGILYY